MPSPAPESGRRAPARVLILGGGFGGLYAATYLGAADLPSDAAEVTLVSATNHFTFNPLLAEVVAGSLGQAHVTFPLRVIAERYGFRFVLGRVERIDPAPRRVRTSAGDLLYDYLIVALGATARFFGNEEIERNSLPLTSVPDALAIRNRVLAMAERAAQATDPRARRRCLTFAVAGAGPAGVEVASEIWHLLRHVLPRYYGNADRARVVILEGGERILRGWDGQLAAAGLERLRDRGIEVHLRTRVLGYDGRLVRASNARGAMSLEADTLIWTAGTAPATGPLADSGLSLAATGHLETDEALRVRGRERIFAVGDCASLVNPRTGRPYPPVAPIAISQGVRAAANVENAIMGRQLEPYQAHHAGKIVSLGSGVALADLLGFRLTGRIAWSLYRITYLLKLVGLQNKVRAATTLALNRIFGRNLSCVD
ncbi:MAG: NAD(P)/FAD-dependent oxidoreductase [Gemmatimonadota bacterium]